eukprot:TRINITY_DN34572_c0_g1_i1.p1 TRINITY_DN34572_c0_g1~~TRINITY_DN34572_c0_g1_i1.p1  ORF type:complete len:178 (-),score=19.93 TRINITY_DN34572_c0_g1_i1:3-536(-)
MADHCASWCHLVLKRAALSLMAFRRDVPCATFTMRPGPQCAAAVAMTGKRLQQTTSKLSPTHEGCTSALCHRVQPQKQRAAGGFRKCRSLRQRTKAIVWVSGDLLRSPPWFPNSAPEDLQRQNFCQSLHGNARNVETPESALTAAFQCARSFRPPVELALQALLDSRRPVENWLDYV